MGDVLHTLPGCPTHVGIGLNATEGICRWMGLPHTRGDRPSENSSLGVSIQVAPHTWG